MYRRGSKRLINLTNCDSFRMNFSTKFLQQKAISTMNVCKSLYDKLRKIDEEHASRLMFKNATVVRLTLRIETPRNGRPCIARGLKNTSEQRPLVLPCTNAQIRSGGALFDRNDATSETIAYPSPNESKNYKELKLCSNNSSTKFQ